MQMLMAGGDPRHSSDVLRDAEIDKLERFVSGGSGEAYRWERSGRPAQAAAIKIGGWCMSALGH